jgi:hypothetical protein
MSSRPWTTRILKAAQECDVAPTRYEYREKQEVSAVQLARVYWSTTLSTAEQIKDAETRNGFSVRLPSTKISAGGQECGRLLPATGRQPDSIHSL